MPRPRAQSRRLEELAYTIPCPTCGAKPPHMCRAASGRHTGRPHKARLAPITAAARYGFARGLARARAADTEQRKEVTA